MGGGIILTGKTHLINDTIFLMCNWPLKKKIYVIFLSFLKCFFSGNVQLY